MKTTLSPLNTWHPQESLSSEFEVIPLRDRKKKHIPTLNRKIFNTLEKHGAWINSQWPFLVHKLVERIGI